MEYAKRYFEEVQTIAKSIELDTIENMVQIIEEVKQKQKVKENGTIKSDTK